MMFELTFVPILRLLIVTPSACDAVKAYEPIFWLIEFVDKVCAPSELSCVTVKLDCESVKELPEAPEVAPSLLEIMPCKLF